MQEAGVALDTVKHFSAVPCSVWLPPSHPSRPVPVLYCTASPPQTVGAHRARGGLGEECGLGVRAVVNIPATVGRREINRLVPPGPRSPPQNWKRKESRSSSLGRLKKKRTNSHSSSKWCYATKWTTLWRWRPPPPAPSIVCLRGWGGGLFPKSNSVYTVFNWLKKFKKNHYLSISRWQSCKSCVCSTLNVFVCLFCLVSMIYEGFQKKNQCLTWKLFFRRSHCSVRMTQTSTSTFSLLTSPGFFLFILIPSTPPCAQRSTVSVFKPGVILWPIWQCFPDGILMVLFGFVFL